MTGTGYAADGSVVFSPSGTVTGNQFDLILTRAFYYEEYQKLLARWSGMEVGKWYAKYPQILSAHGLYANVPYASSSDGMPRENMAQIIYNLMIDKGISVPSSQELQSIKKRIPDFASVTPAVGDAVACCYGNNLITGVDAQGRFSPKGQISRAQMTVIYRRLKNLLNGVSPVTPPSQWVATLSNGQPLTEENVLALMDEYRNGKEPGEKAKAAGFTSYVDLSTYDAYEPKYNLRPFGNGTECAKFAFAFWDDIFGADAPVREITNPVDLRPGDLIWYGGHWSIFIGFKFWELNGKDVFSVMSVDGGATGLIHWDDDCDTFGYIEKLNMDSFAKAIYTRYPE